MPAVIIACPLAVINLMSSWNIILFNHLPAIVVVIGRSIYRMASIASVLTTQLQDIHLCIMPESHRSFLYSGLMVNHQLLLSCCMTIAGYRISNNNSSSQQQPTASYKQTTKSLPGMSPLTRVKTTTSTIYV